MYMITLHAPDNTEVSVRVGDVENVTQKDGRTIVWLTRRNFVDGVKTQMTKVVVETPHQVAQLVNGAFYALCTNTCPHDFVVPSSSADPEPSDGDFCLPLDDGYDYAEVPAAAVEGDANALRSFIAQVSLPPAQEQQNLRRAKAYITQAIHQEDDKLAEIYHEPVYVTPPPPDGLLGEFCYEAKTNSRREVKETPPVVRDKRTKWAKFRDAVGL